MKISGNAFIITGGLGGCGKSIAAAILAEGGHVAVRSPFASVSCIEY